MSMFVDTSPPSSCIFCKLVAREIPAAIVFEDARTLTFMDLGQVNPGHVLVASKRHAANLLELSADDGIALPWPRKEPPPGVLQAHADRLVRALNL